MGLCRHAGPHRPGTLTFAPGETTETTTIQVKGDPDTSGFGYSPGAPLFTKSRGVGTILNDD